MKSKIFGACLLLPLVTMARLEASVTLQFEFEALRDSSGTPVASSTYAIFVVDSNKNNVFPSAAELLGSALSVGGYIGDDRIFYAGLVNAVANLSGTVASLTGNDLGLSSDDEIAGTKWALYWFPGLSSAPEGGLQADQSYGFYHNATIDSYTQIEFGATAAMVMPNNGSTVQVLYLDTATEATAFPSVSDFTASFIVVPEPSAMVLTLLSSALLLRRRRA